jgi:hypothetical protein
VDLRKIDGKVWTGGIWLKIGTAVAGSCEYGNEISDSIKGG